MSHPQPPAGPPHAPPPPLRPPTPSRAAAPAVPFLPAFLWNAAGSVIGLAIAVAGVIAVCFAGLMLFWMLAALWAAPQEELDELWASGERGILGAAADAMPWLAVVLVAIVAVGTAALLALRLSASVRRWPAIGQAMAAQGIVWTVVGTIGVVVIGVLRR